MYMRHHYQSHVPLDPPPPHQRQQPSLSQQHASMLGICDAFDLSGNSFKDCDHQSGTSVMDYSKGESGRNSMVSDEDDPSVTEEVVEGQNDGGRVKKGSPWQRMKWNDGMVKLLITAVSYVGEDDCNSGGGRRKHMILQKKGKWKAISKVMAERKCFVSPQQCEDKFNDLNKRYKRLTDILGRGTACKVVENPVLLEHMHHLTEKQRDDARKILSSKHLFYEEMCSYHNVNRLNLPHDPALQRAIQLALKSKDEHDGRRGSHEDVGEDDRSADSEEEEDAEDHNALHGAARTSCFPKKVRLGADDDHLKLGKPSYSQEYKGSHQASRLSVVMNQLFSENSDLQWTQEQLSSHSLEFGQKRLHIEAEMLELEKKRFNWERFSEKKNRELDKMRLENERMKIENEHMSLTLRQKKLELDFIIKRTE